MKRQINYLTQVPTTTSNRNVPDGAEILGQASYGSGELVYTYYFMRYNPPHPTYGEKALFKVADGVNNVPQLILEPREMRECGINVDVFLWREYD